MLSRILRRRRSKAILYNNCEALPITLFYKIIETGNLALLIREGEASPLDLENVWHGILSEFEQLTGNIDLQAQLRQKSEGTRRVNRLNALIALYYISYFGGEDISEELKYWKVTGTDYHAAKLAIMREKTALNIELIRKGKEKQETTDFYDLWTAVENGLNRNIDVDSCSVKKWVYLCKSLEKKVQAYGRRSNKT